MRDQATIAVELQQSELFSGLAHQHPERAVGAAGDVDDRAASGQVDREVVLQPFAIVSTYDSALRVECPKPDMIRNPSRAACNGGVHLDRPGRNAGFPDALDPSCARA